MCGLTLFEEALIDDGHGICQKNANHNDSVETEEGQRECGHRSGEERQEGELEE